MRKAKLQAVLGRLVRARGEIGWVVLGQALAFFGGLAGIKILTNLMPQSGYGELALGISIAGMLNMFIFGPLSQVVLRYYSVSHDRGDQSAYYQLLRQILSKILLVLTFVGFLTGLGTFAIFGQQWAWLICSAIAFGTVAGVLCILQSLMAAARRRRWMAISQTADVWLRSLLAGLLACFAGGQGYWALAGYGLGSMLVLIVQVRSNRTALEFLGKGVSKDLAGTTTHYQEEFRRFGFPFVAFAGLAAVSQYADRWLLQGYWSEGVVGAYGALSQIAFAPIVLLAGVVTQLIVPVAFARAGALKHDDQAVSSRRLLDVAHWGLVIAYLIATLIALLWGRPLVRWLTNAEYAAYADWLWLMVLGQALFSLAQISVAEGLCRNLSRAYFLPKLAQAVSVLVLGYLLAGNYGIPGMAAAVSISSLIYYVGVGVVNIPLRRTRVAAAT